MYAFHPILDILPSIAHIVGIRSLTSRNLDEFYRRYTVIEAVRGPFFLADDRPFCLTRNAIGQFVGLMCDVRVKTRREFDGIWLPRAINALVPLRYEEIGQQSRPDPRSRVAGRNVVNASVL